MLSSVGRAAIRRLVSTPVATSSGRIAVSRLTTHPLGYGRVVVRGFASAGRPKASTTTASKTTKKSATTKSTATKEKAKKAAPKKASSKDAPTAKAKAKKPKSTAASRSKARAQRKPRKKLTPEKQAILERKELKKTALFNEPKALPETAWTVFVRQSTRGMARGPEDLRHRMSEIGQAYKALSPAEHQRLVETAEQNKVTNAAAHKAWVETHSPKEINDANRARHVLKRKYNYPKVNVRIIRDERLPKMPVNPFSLFTKARWASGDFANRPISEVTKIISREWKGMPPEERVGYEDLAQASRAQYEKDVQSILGRSLYKRSKA